MGINSVCVSISALVIAEYLYPPSHVKQILFVCFRNNYSHSSKMKSRTGISNLTSITSLDTMLSELVYVISVRGYIICSWLRWRNWDLP